MKAIPMAPRIGSREAMVFRFEATNILESEPPPSKVLWNLGDVDVECVSGIPTKGLCQSVTPASDSWSPRTETVNVENRATMQGRIVLSIARRAWISWVASLHGRGSTQVFGSAGSLRRSHATAFDERPAYERDNSHPSWQCLQPYWNSLFQYSRVVFLLSGRWSPHRYWS